MTRPEPSTEPLTTTTQQLTPPPRGRGIFCNRTLNLRAIRAIGYDMDYTLIHYHVGAWERRAYEYLREKMGELGWPVGALEFDPDLVIRGLILDTELGNVVKCDRFGFVKSATHGTRPLEFEAYRELYARTVIDLREPRWVFLNTFFSLSEACMYMQLVDLLDEGRLPKAIGYADLYALVRRNIDETHMEGRLKAEIIANPEHYVDLDPDLPLTLLDQRAAGKKLLLITNSEWHYTSAMMTWAFDRFLPDGMTWRDLFDLRIVSARKPLFFSQRNPIYEVVNEEGLLRPVIGPLEPGRTYHGGDAAIIERQLGLSGSEILYVGDHIFADVNVTKSVLRWRTALVVRELEAEVEAIGGFEDDQRRLSEMMVDKTRLEHALSLVRIALQRKRAGYGPQPDEPAERLEARFTELRETLVALDARIAPLAQRSSQLSNARWGLLMRAGNDKSHAARQIERYADIYLSRVSNFLHLTPFVYLRSPHSSLPHDAE